jgi:hypothetical protein
MRRGAAALSLSLPLLPTGAACSHAASPFSTPAARAHVEALARDIGSRPLGSEANARAREYLVAALRRAGFPDVQVKGADARRPDIGLTARVANIVAMKPGRRSEAIAIVAHYDSVAGSPGATDDALGSAVAVEAGRALAARPSASYSLIVLLTDGEEVGLMGAAAASADRAVADRIVTYLNIDSIGASGPSHLFEAGPGNGWLVDVWAAAAPRPRGASFATDIYRRLPNDTDFTVLQRTGAPGLNFAPIADSYPYHTPRDTADRLSDETIRHTGENIVAIVEAIDRLDLTRRTIEQPVYFDALRRGAIAYGPAASAGVTVVALAAGLLGWLRVTRESLRIAGAARLAAASVWGIAGGVLVWGAMVGATWALRATRQVYHPWYAQPGRLLLLLAIVGLAAGWGAARAGTLLQARLRGVRHPALVWALALPVWIILATFMMAAAPLSSYLWTIPLAAAGVLFMVVPARSAGAIRLASAIVLLTAVVLWVDNLLAVMPFTVAVLGRLPVITPVWVYASLVMIGAIVLAPPAIAMVIGRARLLRPAAATGTALLAVAVAAGLAWAAPAYTTERPQWRSARYVHDMASNAAFWEVAGVEPGLDLASSAAQGWELAREEPPTSVQIGRLPHPFVFRRADATGEPPPVRASIAFDAGSRRLTIWVTPTEQGLSAAIVLTDGRAPLDASLPGRPGAAGWTARYEGLPADGLVFTATLRDAARLAPVRVVIGRAGLPGGAGPSGLPAWLPTDRVVWSAASTWILAPQSDTQGVPGGRRLADGRPLR